MISKRSIPALANVGEHAIIAEALCGRESASAVVASTLTADRVFYPVASSILSAVTILAQTAEILCRP